MRLALGAILLALAGCSDSGEPSDEVPATGRYCYTFDGLSPGLDSIHFQGTLVLTFTSEDSIAGRWEVPGYNPAVLEADGVPTTGLSWPHPPTRG